jgi:TatA/E family protein of Tat protein translocase
MNILGMGPMELVLIVVLALIVFGPAKLPEIMGQVGKAVNDFRRATSELSDEFNRTIQSELQETRSVIDDTKSAVTDMHAAVTGMPAPTRTAVPEALAPPAPNGISSESYTETSTNGSVQTQVLPPMADTSQWSWETSGPKPPAAEISAAETASTEPSIAPPDVAAAPAKPVSPTPPASSSSQEHAAKDELLPPY